MTIYNPFELTVTAIECCGLNTDHPAIPEIETGEEDSAPPEKPEQGEEERKNAEI